MTTTALRGRGFLLAAAPRRWPAPPSS